MSELHVTQVGDEEPCPLCLTGLTVLSHWGWRSGPGGEGIQGAGRSGGRRNCDQDVIYERKVNKKKMEKLKNI